ncbi:MAG: SUMF1/EgtB/PvdO family nonheme iron enzyme, partial [Bacteroidota bacterium]
HVDKHMATFLSQEIESKEIQDTVELGLQHEQQHQELLVTDTKYSLGLNPIFPVYDSETNYLVKPEIHAAEWIPIAEEVVEIGHKGDGFCFDNELSVHKALLQAGKIHSRLVTNAEYLEFMEAGGYQKFGYWLMEGWGWVKENQIDSPLYWHKVDNVWHSFELSGLQPLDLSAPVKHVSYYEADAYARWRGKRLPTEFEWEAYHSKFPHGQLWEWTSSAYAPYPHYETAEGAIGEYNGKFMVNQMVLRGGSIASPEGHVRPTYRNFFHPYLQWQFTGIRLAEWV